MRINLAKTTKYLLDHDNYLLYCHRDPDPDTYGSACALCAALCSLGKNARVTCPTKFPDNLSFLNVSQKDFKEEILVGIDTAAPNMFGDKDVRPQHIDLVIDHHPTNPDFADFTYLVEYAATGEAVYEILKELNVKITPYIATALYAALSGDTGGFNFANTTSQTHRYAADLMDLGADYNVVRQQLYENKSKGRVKVESKAMANAEYFMDGNVVLICVTLKDAQENNLAEDELEGLASEPLKISGVHVAITMKEREDGSIRISMRSDDDRFDVSKVCHAFEGGGHVRASGCRIFTTLDDAKEKVVAQCKKEFF